MSAPRPPSQAHPLTGSCLCGGIRFEITGPFTEALYCHCTHCQHRTGTGYSVGGRVGREDLRVISGRDLISGFTPPGGVVKVFCARCGGHVFSGDPFTDRRVGIRFGALDADPGIRPSFHQFTASAPAWSPVPDDGLPRYPGARPESATP